MLVKDIKTPIGTSSYPYLTGDGDTVFNSDTPFHTKLKLPKAEAAPIIQKINNCIAAEIAEEHKKKPGIEKVKRAPLPYKEVEDELIEFKFKTKFKPKITDKKAVPLDGTKTIWSGTTMRVRFDACSYNSPAVGIGCTLRLKEVQIKDLVEGSAAEGFEEIA